MPEWYTDVHAEILRRLAQGRRLYRKEFALTYRWADTNESIHGRPVSDLKKGGYIDELPPDGICDRVILLTETGKSAIA